MGTLFVSRGGDRNHLIVPRVERAGNAPNRAALAGSVPTLDHHDRRDPVLPRPALQQSQAPLWFGHNRVEASIAKPLVQIQIVEHGDFAIDPIDGARGVAAADGARST